MSVARPSQQPDRLNHRAVIATAIIGVLVVVAALLVSAWVTPPAAGGQLRREEERTLRYRFEDPAHPPTELRAAKRAQLERYGWVDREAGIVHVPLELGIELYLQRQVREEN